MKTFVLAVIALLIFGMSVEAAGVQLRVGRLVNLRVGGRQQLRAAPIRVAQVRVRRVGAIRINQNFQNLRVQRVVVGGGYGYQTQQIVTQHYVQPQQIVIQRYVAAPPVQDQPEQIEVQPQPVQVQPVQVQKIIVQRVVAGGYCGSTSQALRAGY